MTIKSKLLKAIAWFTAFSCSGALVGLAGVYLYLSPSLPSVESLREVKLQTPLRIYSIDQKLIDQVGEKRRIPVTYDEIPQQYIDALLAAEDDQFYSHRGVSIKGLVRATSQLLMSGHIVSGGSTITMQVARNYFLNARQTFKRKFNEILLALRIERELSKQEILELYVNVIFLGNRAYGIQAASQVYYGKELSELSLSQLAMLAGLPKAPSTNNPITNPVRAKQRRDWILQRLADLDKIDSEELQFALTEPLSAQYHGASLELYAPYVGEMVRKDVIELFGTEATTAGYTVITTLQSQLQEAAQKAVIDGVIAYDKRHGYRGPERELEAVNPQEIPTDAPAAAEENLIIAADYEPWIAELKETAVYGNLIPAVVAEVEEKSFKAVLANGEQLEIPWENGLSAARRFITVNARTAPPRKASDVVKVGDLIRLREIEGVWYLSQIPDAQSALVSLRANDGAVLALTGGFDFQQSKFNRITQAERQPGSNFKPFIYARALERGMTAATLINDAPKVFDDANLEGIWRPKNSSGKFYGPMRMRRALTISQNMVAIRIMQELGIKDTVQSLARFGFNTDQFPNDLSLALGSYALPPIEIATAYAAFANGGYKITPYWIDHILDNEGNVVFQSRPKVACGLICERELASASESEAMFANNNPFLFQGDAFALSEETLLLLNLNTEINVSPAQRILEPDTVYIMDSMLKDVIRAGTGRRAAVLKRGDIAGKTGTTDGPADAWFSGYGGGVVTSAWLGFDDNRPIGDREYGGSAALPIWIDYMRIALDDQPEKHYPRPPGIVAVKINPSSGKRASPTDKTAIFELFSASNLPEEAEDDVLNPIIEETGSDDSLPTDLF